MGPMIHPQAICLQHAANPVLYAAGHMTEDQWTDHPLLSFSSHTLSWLGLHYTDTKPATSCIPVQLLK